MADAPAPSCWQCRRRPSVERHGCPDTLVVVADQPAWMVRIKPSKRMYCWPWRPSVGRAIASAKMASTYHGGVALGCTGRRQSLGYNRAYP